MDAGNGTSAHETRVTFLVFNCTVLTLTLVLGLPGNAWVCWLVFRTKSLQTWNNALLVSLAAGDLLKCSVDTPLLLASLLRRGAGRRARVPVCSLQQFTFALCSCVQLLTLVGISVERFRAIAFPQQTERLRPRLWICCIWASGLVLAATSLGLAEDAPLFMLCRPHLGEHGDELLRYSDPFGPYVLVPVWALSLTATVVHYGRIFKVVRQHQRQVFCRGVQVRPTVSEQAWDWASVPGSAPPGPLPAVGSSSPLPARRTLLLLAEDGEPCSGASAGGARGRPPEVVGAVCLLTPEARERGKTQLEGRLAKRFGYIIIAFTLFWVPMVVLLLMDVASWQHSGRLLVELETSALALTCVQAAVDPFIYTLVTRQFRSELRKIFSFVRGFPLKRKT
ncbi:5-hydroxytryptamine receptor 1-like [Aulostomus maculatus]